MWLIPFSNPQFTTDNAVSKGFGGPLGWAKLEGDAGGKMSVRKIATGIALAASIMVSTTGCSITDNIASLQQYAPSDGVSANYGDVKLRNFIYVVEGEHRHLIGSIVNSGLKNQTITLQYTDAATGDKTNFDVTVLAGQKLDFGFNEQPSLEFNILGVAGGTTSLYILQTGTPAQEVVVPVLDGTLPEYADVIADLEH
jgi:hypothetical protein